MSLTEPIEPGQSALIEVFTDLATRADEFEDYPNPHGVRIVTIADRIAKSFRLGPRDRFSLRVAALAHDLGEVVMNRDYLHRQGPLSDDERTDLARHPVFSEREAAAAGADRGAQLLVRWHHEWWNGSGYPDGLRFEQIPLGARILRVADAYASLTDARPFRDAYTEQQAREHIREWTGIEFDPRVVRALFTLEPFAQLKGYAKEVEPPPDMNLIADELMARMDQLGS
ncbi:MAG TPA: HD domain-containing phosphohydrolase [Pyrinomonadaceae bacterium]|jgi:HD-GYP domain-containing protein (c-di-GMP phosphodiesterase class II)|nr:HD domain-containing phosphohydrolase [Pyrinomonadaceae bacterium]